MSLLHNIAAKIARRCPRTIWRLRHFQHLHRGVTLNKPFAQVPDLMTYVIRSAIANAGNSRWALMADKYAVRREVAAAIGEEHLIPLYGHWDDPADIDFDAIPRPFILKTNNGCGTNFFIHRDTVVDRDKIVSQLRGAMDFPYAYLTGQHHYAMIKPCVIAERLMEQGGGKTSLTDYKVHCVNGKPCIIYVFSDRDEQTHYDFNVVPYTTSWQPIGHDVSPADIAPDAPAAPGRPECLEQMLDYAARLSQGEEYVRVDFYIIDGKVYFGEMTYTPDVGYHKAFVPYAKVMDYILERIRRGRADGVSDKTF